MFLLWFVECVSSRNLHMSVIEYLCFVFGKKCKKILAKSLNLKKIRKKIFFLDEND